MSGIPVTFEAHSVSAARSLQSKWKSFKAPAVLYPDCSGSGYNASLPLNDDKPISQRNGQSLIHIGRIPLVGLTSLTLVIVPVVDFAFR